MVRNDGIRKCVAREGVELMRSEISLFCIVCSVDRHRPGGP